MIYYDVNGSLKATEAHPVFPIPDTTGTGIGVVQADQTPVVTQTGSGTGGGQISGGAAKAG